MPRDANDFQMNRPTVVSLLYLGSFLAGITTLIGVVLAYMWKGEAQEPWEESHFRYAIRTFWIGLVYSLLAGIVTAVTLGLAAFIVFPAIAIWFAVRAVKMLLAAQRNDPIEKVESWLF
jgi:uncharacterized membrane protein